MLPQEAVAESEKTGFTEVPPVHFIRKGGIWGKYLIDKAWTSSVMRSSKPRTGGLSGAIAVYVPVMIFLFGESGNIQSVALIYVS